MSIDPMDVPGKDEARARLMVDVIKTFPMRDQQTILAAMLIHVVAKLKGRGFSNTDAAFTYLEMMQGKAPEGLREAFDIAWELTEAAA